MILIIWSCYRRLHIFYIYAMRCYKNIYTDQHKEVNCLFISHFSFTNKNYLLVMHIIIIIIIIIQKLKKTPYIAKKAKNKLMSIVNCTLVGIMFGSLWWSKTTFRDAPHRMIKICWSHNNRMVYKVKWFCVCMGFLRNIT